MYPLLGDIKLLLTGAHKGSTSLKTLSSYNRNSAPIFFLFGKEKKNVERRQEQDKLRSALIKHYDFYILVIVIENNI